MFIHSVFVLCLLLSSCSYYEDKNINTDQPENQTSEKNRLNPPASDSIATAVDVVAPISQPKLLKVFVNGKEPQEGFSIVTKIELEFDSEVQIQAGAFTLERLTLGGVLTPDFTITTNLLGHAVVQLIIPSSTSYPELIESCSIKGGYWLFKVHKEKIFLEGTLDKDYQVVIKKHFGDSNADGIVDSLDFVEFGNTWNLSSSSPYFNSAFDYNCDGVVDGNDFAALGNNYNITLPPLSGPYAPQPYFQVISPHTWHKELTVRFTDKSLNQVHVYTRLWDFGDGVTSTEMNPTHHYRAAGNFTVKLTTTNAYGTAFYTKTGAVTVGNLSTLRTHTWDQIISKVSDAPHKKPRLNNISYIESAIEVAEDLTIDVATQNTDVELFSVYDPANQRYVRNPNFWGKNFNDIGAIAAWNNMYNTETDGTVRGAGLLITPDKIIVANHYGLSNGRTIHFVSKNNRVFVRTIVGYTQVTDGTYTDIAVEQLDSPIPSSEIKPVKFLSEELLFKKYDERYELPLLGFSTNQFHQAAPKEVRPDRLSNGTGIRNSMLPELAAFVNIPIISGDSGSPSFIVINNNLVAATCFFTGGGGPSYFKYFLQIENQIGITLDKITTQELAGFANW